MKRPDIRTLRVEDLSLEQRVGQMLFARHHTLLEDGRYDRLVTRGLIGGVQAAPYAAPPISRALGARLDAAVGIPLLVGADAEEGGVSVCPGALAIPSAGAIGSLNGAATARALARIVGRRLRAAGINTIFGPVLDVNRRPDGPMALRTYGSSMARVERLGTATLQGYLECGLVATAKHYPGGSSHSAEDSHIGVSERGQDLEAARRWDLRAYRTACRAGLNAVMTTHHRVREGRRCRPATFSRAAIGLLRAAGFDGLVISDSLAMGSLRAHWPAEAILRMALQAGHDMVLVDYNQDPAEAFDMMLAAVRRGAVPEAQVNASVARILRAKRRLASRAAPAPPTAGEQAADAARIRAAAAQAVAWRAPSPIDAGAVDLILFNRASTPPVRHEVALPVSRKNGFRDRLNAFFPGARCRPVSEWPVLEIEAVLRAAAPARRVVVSAEAAACAYRGTTDYSEPFLALIRALAPKIEAFLQFGNPNAVRKLPSGLKNVIIAFAGPTAEQAVLDSLMQPGRARGRFRVPAGPRAERAP